MGNTEVNPVERRRLKHVVEYALDRGHRRLATRNIGLDTQTALAGGRGVFVLTGLCGNDELPTRWFWLPGQ